MHKKNENNPEKTGPREGGKFAKKAEKLKAKIYYELFKMRSNFAPTKFDKVSLMISSNNDVYQWKVSHIICESVN